MRMTHRPSRAYQLQNRAFLADLETTGNVRETCRRLAIHRATMTKRRARDPGFAARWDAALAIAHARLAAPAATDAAASNPVRPVRTASGRLQLRRQPKGRLTRAAEQSFLFALSATCNVRLSAAAAGFSHSAFYYRARTNAAFAREMQMALALGYERLEMALLAEYDPTSGEDDAWRSNEPPPIPMMTTDQAIGLLHLHYRTVELQLEAPYGKRRASETNEQWRARRSAAYFSRRDRDEAAARVALATYHAAAGPDSPLEHAPPWLPMIEQVRGWQMLGTMPTADTVAATAERMRAARAGGWALPEASGGTPADGGIARSDPNDGPSDLKRR